MYKTTEGKWLLWRKSDGAQVEQWPIDAKQMLASGEFIAEPPEGTDVKRPPAPPRAITVPTAAPAKVFEGTPGDVVGGEESAPPKRSKKE